MLLGPFRTDVRFPLNEFRKFDGASATALKLLQPSAQSANGLLGPLNQAYRSLCVLAEMLGLGRSVSSWSSAIVAHLCVRV